MNIVKYLTLRAMTKRNDVVKLIAENEKMSVAQLAQSIGKPAANLYDIQSGKLKGVSEKLAQLFIETYPYYSKSWIMTGEGEMLKPQPQYGNISVQGDNNSTANVFYGNDNSVGNRYNDRETYRGKWSPVIPTSMAHMPDFDIVGHLKKQLTAGNVETLYSGTLDIDAWHYIDDDALYPLLHKGDCIGLKAYKQGEDIIPGHIYAVDTKSNGLVVRILKFDDDSNYLACCVNKDLYQDFIIHRSDIITIYRKMIMFRY